MDRAKAEQVFSKIKNSAIEGWIVDSFIDNGKSAAVFRAHKGDEIAAIKIYDDELIERFGDGTFRERCEREQSLIGHDHPNLVRLFGHGYNDDLKSTYLIMEFLEGDSIAAALQDIPSEAIPALVEQLAEAAHYLENNNFVHRDIKPANIVVLNGFSDLKLLDFGVLRPLDESDLTDTGGNPLFIGTNQYASPEFAMRKEQQTPDGWRALTFYQIGAVLHDLLMRRPLFGEHKNVPARLAHAIQRDVPEISADNVPEYLVALAQRCLVKDPEARLKLTSWESFRRPAPACDRMNELKQRLSSGIEAAETKADELEAYSFSEGRTKSSVLHEAREICRDFVKQTCRADPPLPNRITYSPNCTQTALRADFEPDLRLGFESGFSFYLEFSVDDLVSGIITIKGAAATKRMEEDWVPTDLSNIYLGVLESEAVKKAVLESLLECAIAAQSVSANHEETAGPE